MLDKIKKVKCNRKHDSRFSILIPSWNNLNYLKLCVDSIEKNSQFEHQVIIIINEGTDGTIEWIEKQDNLDYVHSSSNIGICYGLNSARSLIKTPYVLYANDDMYFLPGWDIHLHEEIQKIGHNLFMLSSTMIEPTETGNPCVIVADFGQDLSNFNEEKLLSEFNTFEKKDWNGATWPPNIIPLDLWDLVGGMSVEFSPGFYSDPDLSMKLWQVGVRYFKGVSKSRVYHFGSKSTKKIKMNNGKKLFLQKWGMTSGFFTANYLKRGDIFKEELTKPSITMWKNFLNKIKVIISGFKN